LKHRGTEAQRIQEGEIEGGQREGRQREGMQREGRQAGWKIGRGGIKKSTLRSEGCFDGF